MENDEQQPRNNSSHFDLSRELRESPDSDIIFVKEVSRATAPANDPIGNIISMNINAGKERAVSRNTETSASSCNEFLSNWPHPVNSEQFHRSSMPNTLSMPESPARSQDLHSDDDDIIYIANGADRQLDVNTDSMTTPHENASSLHSPSPPISDFLANWPHQCMPSQLNAHGSHRPSANYQSQHSTMSPCLPAISATPSTSSHQPTIQFLSISDLEDPRILPLIEEYSRWLLDDNDNLSNDLSSSFKLLVDNIEANMEGIKINNEMAYVINEKVKSVIQRFGNQQQQSVPASSSSSTQQEIALENQAPSSSSLSDALFNLDQPVDTPPVLTPISSINETNDETSTSAKLDLNHPDIGPLFKEYAAWLLDHPRGVAGSFKLLIQHMENISGVKIDKKMHKRISKKVGNARKKLQKERGLAKQQQSKVLNHDATYQNMDNVRIGDNQLDEGISRPVTASISEEEEHSAMANDIQHSSLEPSSEIAQESEVNEQCDDGRVEIGYEEVDLLPAGTRAIIEEAAGPDLEESGDDEMETVREASQAGSEDRPSTVGYLDDEKDDKQGWRVADIKTDEMECNEEEERVENGDNGSENPTFNQSSSTINLLGLQAAHRSRPFKTSVSGNLGLRKKYERLQKLPKSLDALTTVIRDEWLIVAKMPTVEGMKEHALKGEVLDDLGGKEEMPRHYTRQCSKRGTVKAEPRSEFDDLANEMAANKDGTDEEEQEDEEEDDGTEEGAASNNDGKTPISRPPPVYEIPKVARIRLRCKNIFNNRAGKNKREQVNSGKTPRKKMSPGKKT